MAHDRRGQPFRCWLTRSARAALARRVRWRGFLRRQRAAAVVAWLALLPPVLVVLGWSGPRVRVMVLEEFTVLPWPVACFLGGLTVAVVCVGAGSSPLPRRRAWPAVLLAATGLPPAVLFTTYLERSWATAGLAVGLVVSVVVLAAGFAFRRIGWGMAGFALLYASLALLIALLAVSGTRQPTIGALGWYIGLATHQLTYALGYVVFLVVTLTAPIGLLTSTVERHGRVRRWLGSPRHRTTLRFGAALVGLSLLGWLLVLDRHRSPWSWLVAAVAALAVIAAVQATIRRPVLDLDERLAGWWVAAVVTLPYAVLAPLLVGGSSDAVFAWATALRDWSWAMLLGGAALLGLHRRRLTTGAALLLMVATVEVVRRFGHVVVDLKATVCLLVLLVSAWEAASRHAARQQRDELSLPGVGSHCSGPPCWHCSWSAWSGWSPTA